MLRIILKEANKGQINKFHPTTFLTHSLRYISYFQIFPKSFPNITDLTTSIDLNTGNNIKRNHALLSKLWNVDLYKLRREYRSLQSKSHPDLIKQQSTTIDGDTNKSIDSSLLNRAYQTLKSPLKRAQYILKEATGVDLTSEEFPEKFKPDAQILMQIMMVHETLEEITTEEEIIKLKQENRARMSEIINNLTDAFNKGDLDKTIELAVALKYWTNLDDAIKEWEPKN
ncbi:J-type chaperone JAC1 SCDLUD_001478 [Saccharomycodes ludwigii]|uniref:J-type chaperone JAC1 n=1 Tax=Saccharomycodes ludwigii TaxID=36035 RepID=UPI001E85E44F|nr:hypothetical protein SCDLUD_001478 [Saccharomycodes ludwigii]KAH3901706.1 hypothetical protein SCDLUD_001478 [Saccharomycodes ludwigii]